MALDDVIKANKTARRGGGGKVQRGRGGQKARRGAAAPYAKVVTWDRPRESHLIASRRVAMRRTSGRTTCTAARRMSPPMRPSMA